MFATERAFFIDRPNHLTLPHCRETRRRWHGCCVQGRRPRPRPSCRADIGLFLHHGDASNLFLSLSGKHYDTLAAAKLASAPTINYGLFLNTAFNFLIVAFAVFFAFLMLAIKIIDLSCPSDDA
jgi:hypothetical protein